jgi:ADP-ribosylglycohydrolase
MIGAILGDIIGSVYEFDPIKTKEFKLFNRECRITDDTVMTIATADALLNKYPFEKAYMEWGNRYPDAGYGGFFWRWLNTENPKPYNSYGNGSAMRVSPVGWLGTSLYAVNMLAKQSARVTHNHPEGIKGAQAIASAIFLARQGKSKEDIKIWIETHLGYDLSQPLDDIRLGYKFDETCQGSVPESIICFLESTSFEDAIRNAISLGGDADTQAAIAGSIAEAFYGIPTDLTVKIHDYLPSEMADIVEQFCAKIIR